MFRLELDVVRSFTAINEERSPQSSDSEDKSQFDGRLLKLLSPLEKKR